MAEYDLGRATGRIDIDASGAKRGFRDASDEAQGFTGKLNRAAPALRKVGGAMMGIGAAAVAGIGVAVKASADFEKEISNFQAAAKETPEVLEQVRQKALQIGRDTSFGAGQAAEAITSLSYAGLSTEEILNGAADAAVSLAEAGELDMAQASTIMTSSMNTFGIAAEDATKVADTMIGVFANSDTMVDELGEALKNTSATASTLGVSLEDTTVALGLLADKGIKGGRAGTTLNRMLLSLQGSTGPAKEAMKELGLITEDGANQFFDASGNIKNMAEVSQTLQDSLKGLTKEQQTAYLEAIFGSRALSAAAAMASAGAEGFNELAGEMSKIDAADVAADKLDNLAGAMTILKGTIETTLIGVGAPLQEVLKGIVQSVTGLLNAFASLPPEVQKFITIGILVLGILTGIGGAFLFLAGTLPIVAAGLGITTGALLAGIGIAAAIVVGILAVGAALYLLWTRSETFRDIVIGSFEAVKSFILRSFRAAMDWLKEVWAGIQPDIEALGGHLLGLVDRLRQLRDAVMPVIQWIGERLPGAFRMMWAIVGPIVRFLAGLLLDTLKLAIEGVVQAFRGAVQIINGILDVFIGLFTGNWSQLWEGVKGILTGAWDLIVGLIKTYLAVGVLKVFGAAFKGLLNLIRGSWRAILNLFKGFFRGAGNTARSGVQGIHTTIMNVFRAIQNFMRNILTNILNGIRAFIRGALNFVKSGFRGMWNSIRSIGSTIRGFISSVFRAYVNIIRGAVNGARNVAVNAFNAMKNGVTGALNGLLNFVRGIPGHIRNAFGQLGNMLYNIGKRAIESLVRGLGAVMGAVAAKAQRIKDSIKAKLNPANWFSTPEEHYRKLWGAAFESIGDEGKRKLPQLERVAGSVAGAAGGAMPPSQGRGSSAQGPSQGSSGASGFAQHVHIERIEARDPHEAAKAADEEMGWQARRALAGLRR